MTLGSDGLSTRAFRRSLWAIACTTALTVLVGCSGSADPAVTVTVETTVATAVATSSAPATSVLVATDTLALVPGATGTGAAPPTSIAALRSPAEPTPATTAVTAISAAGTTRRSAAPTASAAVPGTAVTTWPRQASADTNAAGPDHGPACAVDARYSDEPPTGLRGDVRTAWIRVKQQAAAKHVTLCLNDGKRSKAQQEALFDHYVKQYGPAAARVYVLHPDKSAHVKGYAVDVQPTSGFRWLQASRGKLGWCRVYDNEPWHFEYSVSYRTSGCPARLPAPVR